MATNLNELSGWLAGNLTEVKATLDTHEKDFGEALDTIWMLLCAMLVFFMHSGFSMLEAGSVRFKNTQNILAKNLFVVSGGFLCWYFLGYGFAIGAGDDPNKFGGTKNFVMDGFLDDKTAFRVWFFQGAFCATGATIVSGAIAERTKLEAFGLYVLVMTSIIYPFVAYWGWSGSGFLYYTSEDSGEDESIVGPAYKDFAGSGIVHMVGGVGALVGAIAVGPRKGRFEPGGEAFDAHSVPFVVLGTFFLWFGWYGFNPGSTLSMKSADDAYTAGLVATNTTLAPCVAGLVVFFLRWKVVEPKCLDVCGFCNGILGGLVAITAGCAFVKSWEAMVIGFIGGLLYQGASMLLRYLKIDDVVDAIPVHGVCGAWGVIAVGFFGDPDEGLGGNGVFYGGDQLGVQIVGVLFIALWSAALTAVVFVPLRFAGQLRLSDEFQDTGADIMEHSPSKAYSNHDVKSEGNTGEGKTDNVRV